MNEYCVFELNVQNGVLKFFLFLFEYIGEMGKDYIYVVIFLLEDVLMDRLDNELIFYYIYNIGGMVGQGVFFVYYVEQQDLIYFIFS